MKVLAVLGVCLFLAMPAFAAPSPKIVNGADGIFAAFQSHPIVGLGEWHGLAQEMDFYVTLIRDPRGTRFKPDVGKHLVFSFLTTEASPDVAPIHRDATPVLLLDESDREMWLTAPWEFARSLQRPPPAGALKIVAVGSRQDGET